jgi:Trk K+ transport system NAD-binding subunit
LPRPTRLAANLRYAGFLLREFRGPLMLFLGLLFGGALLFHLGHEAHPSFARACYEVYTMLLIQPTSMASEHWYLQIFAYVVPIVGVLVIADSMVRLGILVFQKKSRLKEWWVMQASAYSQHIVVVGVGKVGYRIIGELTRLGEPVVGIDRESDKYLVKELQDQGVPIITGEARLRTTLIEANVARATAIICAINDDVANLDIGLTARELNPDIRVVLRIFDDTLAQRFASTLKLPAISTSQTAAHVFVAAATGRSVYTSFRLAGEEIHMADLEVGPRSTLAGITLAALETAHGVRVVCCKTQGQVAMHPAPGAALAPGDTVVVVASEAKLRALEALNRRA